MFILSQPFLCIYQKTSFTKVGKLFILRKEMPSKPQNMKQALISMFNFNFNFVFSFNFNFFKFNFNFFKFNFNFFKFNFNFFNFYFNFFNFNFFKFIFNFIFIISLNYNSSNLTSTSKRPNFDWGFS